MGIQLGIRTNRLKQNNRVKQTECDRQPDGLQAEQDKLLNTFEHLIELISGEEQRGWSSVWAMVGIVVIVSLFEQR